MRPLKHSWGVRPVNNSYLTHRDLYATTRWRKLRKSVLRRDGYRCQACLREGVQTPGEEVDHVVPAIQAPERFWDAGNLQTLCREHHLRKTADEKIEQVRERKRVRYDIATGRPVEGRNSGGR